MSSATAVSSLLLLSLTTVTNEDESGRLGALPADMRAEVERQRAEKQAEATKAAATQVLELMGSIDQLNACSRANVRDYRAAADREIEAMNARDMALQYGMESGNYIPVIIACGHRRQLGGSITREEWDKLSVIPEDWKAKYQKAKTAQASPRRKTANKEPAAT